MIKLERILFTSGPVSFIREWSKRHTLPGFQGICLYDVFSVLAAQIKQHGLNIRAAAISFNLVMAIPAILLFLCTLVPIVPGSQQVYKELLHFVRDFTPSSDTKKVLVQLLNDFFKNNTTGLISIGFLLVVFTASNAMMGVIRAFDRSLNEKRKTNFIKKRLRAIRLISMLIGLIIGTILISVGQGYMFGKIMSWLNIHNATLQAIIQNSRLLVGFFLFVYAIGYIYKYAPSYTIRRKLFTPGAVIAAILMIAITSLFSFWAQNMSNYNKVYGSIGSLIIIMLLIFLNSLMLLIGYELNLSIYILAAKRKLKESKKENNPVRKE
ncbi:YihY/virulence factor BrkB family protein [Ilyomonas limi]|uniref:YihY/virulence factor BrkB family protein n=1 Tax=Ilyomonas limi TaxID=2575867 RepID=A0A4U3LAH1_9BACT|nr:YihY/virulence factor BrkB family protein [Ilyomonas limi]TKK70777.1 YihY/virulence factor BrkB family protein [Ilyomonas limi]